MSKKRRFQKPGLWFSSMRAEIEIVSRAHKKVCAACGKRPTVKRLKITKGTGRHQTTLIFCQSCGNDWINDFRDLTERAKDYLFCNDLDSVRDLDG